MPTIPQEQDSEISTTYWLRTVPSRHELIEMNHHMLKSTTSRRVVKRNSLTPAGRAERWRVSELPDAPNDEEHSTYDQAGGNEERGEYGGT